MRDLLEVVEVLEPEAVVVEAMSDVVVDEPPHALFARTENWVESARTG
jgi:hypothetical protein